MMTALWEPIKVNQVKALVNPFKLEVLLLVVVRLRSWYHWDRIKQTVVVSVVNLLNNVLWVG